MEQRTTNRSVLTAPLEDVEVRTGEQAGDGQMSIAGYAAVFDRLSDDLGGFRERINQGAFSNVLASEPDVHINWDHDSLYTLGRTRSGTLELGQLERGLRFYNRTAPTSYAKDLGVLMTRGDIDQASFKFTIAEEEWHEADDGAITARVLEIGQLFDVCICAQGAYPQTESALGRKRLDAAIEDGRVLGRRNGPKANAEERERRAAERQRRLTLAHAR